jgi:hypothetical protein
MSPLPKATRFALAMGALAVAAVALAVHGQASADTDPDPLGERAGGQGTVFANGRNAFSFPLAHLSDAGRPGPPFHCTVLRRLPHHGRSRRTA